MLKNRFVLSSAVIWGESVYPSLFPMVIVILPVFVLILQIPPEVESGTFTLPVVVLVLNIFSVRRLPTTSPVIVSISSVSASQSVNVVSPVVLVAVSLPATRTRFISRLPDVPSLVRLAQLTFVR